MLREQGNNEIVQLERLVCSSDECLQVFCCTSDSNSHPWRDRSSYLITLNDGKRKPDSCLLVWTGGSVVLVRAVVSRLLADYPHLHYLVRFEDNSEEASGLPLGFRLAVCRLLRLRSLESFPHWLAGLRHSRGHIHFCQHQLFLLDCCHCCLPVRLHREVQPKSRWQPGVVLPPCQVSEWVVRFTLLFFFATMLSKKLLVISSLATTSQVNFTLDSVWKMPRAQTCAPPKHFGIFTGWLMHKVTQQKHSCTSES